MPLQKPRSVEKISSSDEDTEEFQPQRLHKTRRADTLHLAPSSSFYQSAARNRMCVLIAFALVAVAALILGIAFASRYYYVIWGGQNAFQIIGKFKAGTLGLDDGIELRKRSYHEEIGTRDNSNFTCASKQNDCSGFSKTNICCPGDLTCFSTTYTSSGIYCCDNKNQTCDISDLIVPICPSNTFSCTHDQGGACCPSASLCSFDGCVLFDGSGLGIPATTTVTTTIVSTKTIVTSTITSTLDPGETVPTSTGTATKTITQIIDSSISPSTTTAKIGEVLILSRGSSLVRPDV